MPPPSSCECTASYFPAKARRTLGVCGSAHFLHDGFTDATLDSLDKSLSTAFHLTFVFNRWTLGDDVCLALGQVAFFRSFFAIPPILTNAYIAIRSADPETVEAFRRRYENNRPWRRAPLPSGRSCRTCSGPSGM